MKEGNEILEILLGSLDLQRHAIETKFPVGELIKKPKICWDQISVFQGNKRDLSPDLTSAAINCATAFPVAGFVNRFE